MTMAPPKDVALVTSTLVPASDLAPHQRLAWRHQARDLVRSLMVTEKKGTWEQIAVRDPMPNTDFPPGSGTGFASERWVLPAQTANQWTTFLNLTLAQTKAVCFYGVALLDATPGITMLRYQSGSGGGGGSKGIFNLEVLEALETVLALHTPVLYKPGDAIFAQTYGNLTGATPRMVPLVYVAELRNDNLSPALATIGD